MECDSVVCCRSDSSQAKRVLPSSLFRSTQPKKSTFFAKKKSFQSSDMETSASSSFSSDFEDESIEPLNFAEKMNQNFDLRKMYEDTILTILNTHARELLTNPAGSVQYKKEYAKPETLKNLKKTLFIDLDDTLVKVSMQKLHIQPHFCLNLNKRE